MPFDDFDNNDFEFDNDDFDAEEFAKEDSERTNKAKNHPLNLQVNELSNTLDVLLDNPKTENEMIKNQSDLIRESLMIVKAKLYSALRSNYYLVCMQNASIIRYHADYLLLSSHSLNSLKCYDKDHVAVFRNEMEVFQKLFKTWAKEIKEMDKEDFEDEWGLF